MRAKCSFTALFWSLLPLSVAILSTAAEMNDLPPPTNITITMADMFNIIFKWDHADANCTPKYNTKVSQGSSSFMTTEKQLSRRMEIKSYFNLNNNFSVEILAFCNDRRSPSVTREMLLVPGYQAVKNLSCFWQFEEYINCTWELRADAPRDLQYRLLYWDKDTNSDILPESTQFEDLLRSGNECQEYYTSGGMHLGCKFTYEYRLEDHKQLMFAVTDTLYSVRPYLYYTKVRHIAKLKSPNITNVSEPINKVIHVNWTALPDRRGLQFEVLVSSDTWSLPPHTVKPDTRATITIPHDDDTFRVKVRAKLSELLSNSVFWSEWSQEWIVPGKNKTSILLFLLIPAVVLVAAVILLVFLKRLKILICPPIPHPGKMFQNDLQHWLRGDRPAPIYDQAMTEEITAVTALEV